MFHNFSKGKRKAIIILFFVVLAALVFLAVTEKKQRNQEVQAPFMEDTSGVSPVKGGTAAQTKIYTQLVAEYSTRRIQFDEFCQAHPNNVTYKNGTKVMFDNRSGDARYISVGGVSYYLPGYGYKILTLSSSKLPKTLYLNCGAGVNVGQILLQR